MYTLWRSLRALAVIAVLLMTMALAAGCGGQQDKEQAAPSGSASPSVAGLPTAEEILTKAMEADEQVEHLSATYKATITIDADMTAVPESTKSQMGPFLQGPIKVSGTVRASERPMAADMTAELALANGSVNLMMGLRVKEAAGWLQFMGQWYELPPEVTKSLKESSTTGQEPTWTQFQQVFTELGIDPKLWAKELTVVGEESLKGVSVYHLRVVPDVTRLVTDMVTLLKSKQFAKLLGGQVSAEDLQRMQGLSDADLKEMQQTVDDVLQNAIIELWVRTDTYVLAKMTAGGTIVPPAEEAEGVRSIATDLTVTMRQLDAPVTVQAPPSPRPYTELEEIFGTEAGGLFGGATLDNSTQ